MQRALIASALLFLLIVGVFFAGAKALSTGKGMEAQVFPYQAE